MISLIIIFVYCFSQENDGPESAVTNLFASSRKDNTNMREHGAFTNCMHNFPSEGQIQVYIVIF